MNTNTLTKKQQFLNVMSDIFRNQSNFDFISIAVPRDIDYYLNRFDTVDLFMDHLLEKLGRYHLDLSGIEEMENLENTLKPHFSNYKQNPITKLFKHLKDVSNEWVDDQNNIQQTTGDSSTNRQARLKAAKNYIFNNPGKNDDEPSGMCRESYSDQDYDDLAKIHEDNLLLESQV